MESFVSVFFYFIKGKYLNKKYKSLINEELMCFGMKKHDENNASTGKPQVQDVFHSPVY